MANEMSPHFIRGSLSGWAPGPVTLGFGGILTGLKGTGTILHNFRKWTISEGTTMTFFPDDVVHLESASDDFDTCMLVYSAEILRSASMQIESVVYEWLRNDCCTTDPRAFGITEATFRLLGYYLNDEMFESSAEIILLHLKAYFLGVYDSVRNIIEEQTSGAGRGNRIREQFNRFMEMLEKEYRTCHSVSHYAEKLSITPKHLTTITRRISGKSAKDLIDEYVTMRLKLTLSESTVSIKEIAWSYNFPSTAFLCSYFSRHTGMTPQQYRRMHPGETGKDKK